MTVFCLNITAFFKIILDFTSIPGFVDPIVKPHTVAAVSSLMNKSWFDRIFGVALPRFSSALYAHPSYTQRSLFQPEKW